MTALSHSPPEVKEPRFIFRCDVSPTVGTGHLRRCLVVAAALKAHGSLIFFAIRTEGFDPTEELIPVATDWSILDWSVSPAADVQEVLGLSRSIHADALILDHYRVDEAYQLAILDSGIKWLQFAYSTQQSQAFWADWVLNYSPAARPEVCHNFIRGNGTRLLLGPSYALLRPEFSCHRDQTEIREHVTRIVLMFGGANDNGATLFCSQVIAGLETQLQCTILIGSTNPYLDQVVEWIRRYRGISSFAVLIDDQNVASHMSKSDLVIIAGGGATFEAAALGVPCIIIQTSSNQVQNAEAWERKGTAMNLGAIQNLSPDRLRSAVCQLMRDPQQRRLMSCAGRALVDCRGADRVAQILLSSVQDAVMRD